jgi:hypothetical protein
MNHVAFADLADENENFAIAIAHVTDDGKVRFDEIHRHAPPFDRARKVADFVKVARRFECGVVWGERFANGWTTEALRKHGLRHQRMENDRPDVLRDFFALLDAGKVMLPPNEGLQQRLSSMQRRRSNDAGDLADLVNVIAGAAVAAHAEEMVHA